MHNAKTPCTPYIDNRNDAGTSAVIAKGLTVQTDTPHAIMVIGGGLLSMAGNTVTSQSGVALYGYDTTIAGTSVNRALITDSTLTLHTVMRSITEAADST